MAFLECFCWTRFGTEAGEIVQSILDRKELERRRNGGYFLWGIGNSVGTSLITLINSSPNPQVVFSPIRSSPRVQDVSPVATVRWEGATGLDGLPYLPPVFSQVRSGRDPASRRRNHYALVCYSETPLLLGDLGTLNMANMKNIVSGKRVGASQVTSVVKYEQSAADEGTKYPIAFVASLTYPFLATFSKPVPISGKPLGDLPSVDTKGQMGFDFAFPEPTYGNEAVLNYV